jgi:hypothetical protein
MSHFAEIDENNIVKRVLVGDPNLTDEQALESLVNSLEGVWVQTSYNAATNGFRKNYAGIGFTYDQTRDAFIPLKPDNAISLDEDTCTWIVPELEFPSEDSPK